MKIDSVTIAAKAVRSLIDDLEDRRGLRHEWEQIDAKTQEEIRVEWIRRVAIAIDEAVTHG